MACIRSRLQAAYVHADGQFFLHGIMFISRGTRWRIQTIMFIGGFWPLWAKCSVMFICGNACVLVVAMGPLVVVWVAVCRRWMMMRGCVGDVLIDAACLLFAHFVGMAPPMMCARVLPCVGLFVGHGSSPPVFL